MTKLLCRFAEFAANAVEIDAATMRERPTEVVLCGWADAHPDRLVDVPRWVQRNCLSGHLLNYPSDCIGCPAFKPLEGERG